MNVRRTMMMTGRYAFAIATIVCVVVVMSAGAAAGRARRSSSRTLTALKRSSLPLARGAGDCPRLAAHYATLGALVRAHDKLAVRESVVHCETHPTKPGVLACTARFSNSAPSAKAEGQSTLRLEYEMKGSTIAGLKCSVGG
jgi:hypothetical protein